MTINSINNGGRVFYIGAGTSGRLMLDASEIPPTFSAPQNYFNGIIAGGDFALRNSIEGAEDNTDNAVHDLKAFSLNKFDTVIGISYWSRFLCRFSSGIRSRIKGKDCISNHKSKTVENNKG